VSGWQAVYDKPSVDGSAKLNIRPAEGFVVDGVLFEIEDSEREALDHAEPRYDPISIDVGGREALTYTWTAEAFTGLPYEWYVSMVEAGANSHGVQPPHAEVAQPDPLAPGLRVAGSHDLPALQKVLSTALVETDTEYIAHPGDIAWWIHHVDPRWNLTLWRQGESAIVVLEETGREISVFATPGTSRFGLIEWAQRRLGGAGEVGWVADTDVELIAYLEKENYSPVHTERNYEWDLLNRQIPVPALPEGWTLRTVRGEEEADNRRAASHAAFESTLEPGRHLNRYLGYMRSPVYDKERDLVAVAPDGRIAAFMIWWPDSSGIAQIEPFGTHPDFQRQGIGRALIHFGLLRMREAGMRITRVGTNEPRKAIEFYEGVGFVDVGRIRWWKRDS
jgi:ribosomal protein S18 acetylase RimI-like enzyme